MGALESYLPDVFFLILGLVLFLYWVTDGFNLGLGIYSLAIRSEQDRGLIIHSIARTWYAGQIWLIVLGGGLFGSFPVVYRVVSLALCIPVMLMLAGLAVRGVAIKFYDVSPNRRRWGLAFGLGSLVATLTQGFLLGGLLGGLPVAEGQFAGGYEDWLNPLSTLIAATGAAGFVLMGMTYLIMKAEEPLRERSIQAAVMAAWAFGCGLVLILFWISLQHYEGHYSLLSLKQGHYLYFALPLFLIEFVMLLRSLKKAEQDKPFQWSVLLFLTLAVGLASALYPSIMPPALTIFDAAAPAQSLLFLLVVSVVLLPVMLAYNAWLYRLFGGRVREGARAENGQN